MTIQVTGILRDAFGQPIPKATIRIIPVETGSTLLGMYGKAVTDASGTYTFTLGNGKYSIEAMQGIKKYYLAGIVLVDGTVVSPITLESLITTHAICKPEVVNCTEVV